MIRRATILDISALAIMLNTMHKETELKVSEIKSDKLINKINELIHNGLVFVSIKDNKIQGSIAGQICQDWWSEEKYVGDAWFFVFKEQRKSDVAKKLLQTYIKTAKDAKMKIRLGIQSWKTDITLAKRTGMTYPMLIGRNSLLKQHIIHSHKSYLTGKNKLVNQ